MPRNPVRVAVRTRPTSSFASNLIEIDPDSNVIVLHNETMTDEITPFNNQNLTHHFHYHQVFLNANQDDVYDASAREIVQNTIYGSNGAIIAYGQTGSGKTFTMIGDTKNYEHRGIAPRAISHLFAEIHARSEIEYRVVISNMEIYNERIYDLLADFSESAKRSSQEYTILEDRHGKGVYVRGLTEVEVQTEEEALNLLFSGELGKTTARHLLNRRSNRSHSIFTITLYQKPKSGVSEKTVISKLNLVDLAGSERLKKTLDRQEQMGGSVDSVADEVIKKESRSINQSLSYLEQCILALSSKQPTSHIPYRQTKLTNILKDSIGGNCNTLFLTCIYAEQAHLEETLSSLRMAQRMMRVENETHTVESVDTSKLLKKYEMTIKELKQELLMIHSFHKEQQTSAGSEDKSVGELSTNSINYSDYSEEERAKLKRDLHSFVRAPIDLEEEEMPRLESLRQMKEMLKLMKRMVLDESLRADELDAQLRVVLEQQQGASSFNQNGLLESKPEEGAPFDLNLTPGERADFGFVSEQDRVGNLSEGPGAGISLGQSYSNPPPPQSRESVRELSSQKREKEEERPSEGKREQPLMSPTPSHPQPLSDRDVLFSKFKSSKKGNAMNQEFMRLKRVFKSNKYEYNRQRKQVNDLSEQIRAMGVELTSMQADRERILRAQGIAEEELENMVDEEEFELMKRLKEAKRMYRRLFTKLEEQKKELETFSEEVEEARQGFLSSFDQWSQKYLALGAGSDQVDDWEDALGDSTGERMDDQEMFEQMERAAVMSQDPASLAFFLAKKTQKANKTQHGVDLRQMHRTKRFG